MTSKSFLWLLLLFFLSDFVIAAETHVKTYRQGFALFGQDKYEEAISKWKKALKGRKSLSRRQQLKLFLGMSRAYEKLGDKTRALKTITWAERIAPNNKAVKKCKARLSKGSLSISEAFETLENALLLERATSGAGKDSFKEAAVAFRRAIKDQVDLSRAHYGLGTCLYYTEVDSTDAEHHLIESHRLAPQSPETNWQLAVLYKKEANLAKEIIHLTACLGSGSSKPKIEVAAASAFGRRNDKEDEPRVLDHAAKAIAFDPSYGETIIAEITDEGLKAKIKEMMKKAEAEARERDKKEEKVLIVKYFSSPT